MIDFHIDEKREFRVVARLDEISNEVKQNTAQIVANAQRIRRSLPALLTPRERKMQADMQPYIGLAEQEYRLTGEVAVRFAFAHEIVRQICLGYYKTNQDLFSDGNIDTQLKLFSWIIDDATVKMHLVNSGKPTSRQDIQIARLGLIQAAANVPKRIAQRSGKWHI